MYSGIYKEQFGTSECQQVTEAIAILIGLRVWLKVWQGDRAWLKVKSDSSSALTMTAARKCKAGSALVAKELAITLSTAAFLPELESSTNGQML